MTERHKFIRAHEQGLFTMTELCQRFAISRKTAYKWLHRYREGGLEALGDRSRAPKTCPHRTPQLVQDLLIATRRAHPRWGPRKLLDYLRPKHPTLDLPAASTVGDVLKRHGLLQPSTRQRRHTHPGAGPLHGLEPGQIWTADFKGEFRLGSGPYCYPLTVQEPVSRYLLACQGLPSTGHDGAQPVFEQLFRAHGLPERIRTDNGGPKATKAICGLSRLSVYWIKLGIMPERIQPGCPQQNGRHERMHRTLKAETTRPPGATFSAQQARFDAFEAEYNQVRPHQALDGAVPASHYRQASRVMPAVVPAPAYAAHMEVRLVSGSGTIKFKNRLLFITSVLAGEPVALEEIDEGLWSIYFYDMLLGRLDERSFTLHTGMK